MVDNNSGRKQLLRLYDGLPNGEREMLLTFAEFLSGRSQVEERPAPVPEPIPRPDEETVIGAVKRLSSTYHMLEKSKVLHETSALVSQHVLQGREACEVIDELEVIFQRHYEAFASKEGDV